MNPFRPANMGNPEPEPDGSGRAEHDLPVGAEAQLGSLSDLRLGVKDLWLHGLSPFPVVRSSSGRVRIVAQARNWRIYREDQYTESDCYDVGGW